MIGSAEPLKWKGDEFTYEGYPLLLRWVIGLDYDEYKQKYPIRATLTHTFDERYNNGLPKKPYNSTLENFDYLVLSYLEDNTLGQTVLVETFGGERNYYMYASSEDVIKQFFEKVKSKYPNYKINIEYTEDADWWFIKTYSKDWGLNA